MVAKAAETAYQCGSVAAVPRNPHVDPRMTPAQPAPPLYHRIYLVLRQRVLEGRYPVDRPMPGEHELAAEYGASRITIRRALATLEEQGLVVRRRGAGTFARPPAPAEPVRENLRGLIENLLQMGLSTTVRLIAFDHVPATPELAALMGLAAGAEVQRSVRVRSARGQPFSHLTAWVPDAIGRRYGRDDLAARPLLALLEESGVAIARAEQTISARLADSVVAPLLGVEIGAALLWVRRQVFSPEGQVIELLEALYRPELYAYQIGLVRDGALWSPQRAEP
jgi:GntR family transcriptional regulator